MNTRIAATIATIAALTVTVTACTSPGVEPTAAPTVSSPTTTAPAVEDTVAATTTTTPAVVVSGELPFAADLPAADDLPIKDAIRLILENGPALADAWTSMMVYQAQHRPSLDNYPEIVGAARTVVEHRNTIFGAYAQCHADFRAGTVYSSCIDPPSRITEHIGQEALRTVPIGTIPIRQRPDGAYLAPANYRLAGTFLNGPASGFVFRIVSGTVTLEDVVLATNDTWAGGRTVAFLGDYMNSVTATFTPAAGLEVAVLYADGLPEATGSGTVYLQAGLAVTNHTSQPLPLPGIDGLSSRPQFSGDVPDPIAQSLSTFTSEYAPAEWGGDVSVTPALVEVGETQLVGFRLVLPTGTVKGHEMTLQVPNLGVLTFTFTGFPVGCRSNRAWASATTVAVDECPPAGTYADVEPDNWADTGVKVQIP